MKKHVLSLCACMALLSANAQDKLYVYQKDGKVVEYAVSNLDSLSFNAPASQPQAEPKMFLRGQNVYDVDGPLEYEWAEIGPSGSSGGVLCYPKQLTEDPSKEIHPVVIFCPGGGETPQSQSKIIKRLASMGFVVYSQPSSWDGEGAIAAFDWLEQMNNDPAARFYGKLNMKKVGICGHSQGGGMAEDCANKDSRVATLFMMNSGSFSHDGATKLTIPTAFMAGEVNDVANENAKGDYGNAANKAPMWLGIKSGEGHGYGPWGGVYCVVAWLRWHLCGEDSWRDAFLKEGGEFYNKNGWVTSIRNW